MHWLPTSFSRKAAPRRRPAFCGPRLETLEARVLPATVNWINPAGGDWDTPGDWSTGVLPGAGDDVVIDLPGQNTFAVTHSANVADTVHSLTSDDGLIVSGGSLSVAAASTVVGGFTLTGGTLSGGGTGSLTAQGGAGLHGGTLDGVTVQLLGNSSLDGGVTLVNGAVLDNQGTLALHDGSSVGCDDSSNVQFRNEGLLEKLDGTVNAGLNVPIVNTGTIDLESGGMSLGDRAGTLSTSAGPITAAAGTLLELDSNWSITGAIQGDQVQFGGQDFIAGSYSAGATQLFGAQVAMTGTVAALGNLSIPGIGTPFGTLDLSAATLAPAAYTLSGLSFNGGTLVASGAFTVTGPMAAYNSTLLAPTGTTASLTALQGASLGGTDNNSSLVLDGFTLVNPVGQTSNLQYSMALYDGAVFDNEGTLTVHDTSRGGAWRLQ